MSRILIGWMAWYGLGVIAAESLNSAGWFDFRLNAPLVAVPIALVYLVLNLALTYFKRRADETGDAGEGYRRVSRVYLVLLVLVGLCCAVGIPLLWWGVIQKLAGSANEGARLF